MDDRDYMRMAIELAKQGGGYNSPNPFVGAVVVKDGRVIGKGYHEFFGKLHAERNALANCTENPEGATIYVTLEPCCHYGKTPPCTEAIIENKLSRVVVGSNDPNPLVSGKGFEILRSHGITVDSEFLKDECDAINNAFFHHISTRMPYVTCKYAMTMDGKICSKTGKSQWISGPESRVNVHKDRALNMGIMVGIGTVLADNPSLTVRDAEGLNPIRIICDSKLRTPLDAKVMQDLGPKREPVYDKHGKLKYTDIFEGSRYPRTIIATTITDESKLLPYKVLGAEIISVEEDENGHINLKDLMKILGERDVNSIMLEGGSSLNWSALEAEVVNKMQVYVSGKIFGGAAAKSPITGIGIDEPDDAFTLKLTETKMFGNDILIESEVEYSQNK